MVHEQISSDLVSICLPVWNGERYLKTSITSALAQTHSNFELVIVDDCSTDRSVEIIESFAREDQRIKFYRNKSRLGLFANYNRCMLMADGEFIKPFAQDDQFHPEILEKLIELMQGRPEIVLASCARNVRNEQGLNMLNEFYSNHASNYFEQEKAVRREDVLLRCVRPFSNIIGEATCVMYRRKYMGGGFYTGYSYVGDLEYWLRLLLHGAYTCTKEVLCTIRHQTMDNPASLSFFIDQLALTRQLTPELVSLGLKADETASSTLIEIAQHILKLIAQEKMMKPQNGGSVTQVYLWQAFEALGAPDANKSSAGVMADSAAPTNMGRLSRMESQVRSLLADAVMPAIKMIGRE